MGVDQLQPVRMWLIPKTVKELQWFLGFANFYHSFIRNYSTVVVLLSALFWGEPKLT